MLKRILVLLPAIWLIASIVFFLSKNIPGDAADFRFESAGQDRNSVAKSEVLRKAQLQFLKRTGQDLPLFYVSLAAASEPDTLYKIWPETDRDALKKMALRYGSWPAISNYYHAVSALRTQISIAGLSPEHSAAILKQPGIFLSAPDFATVSRNLAVLKSEAKRNHKTDLLIALNQVEISFKKIAGSSEDIKKYVPVIKWRGFNNQYHRWLIQVFQGNLGYSSRDSQPVLNLVAEAFKLTFTIALVTLCLVCSLAVIIGMFLSRKENGVLRSVTFGALYLIDALPLFIIALLLLLISGGSFLASETVEIYNIAPVILCLVLVNLPYLTGQFYAALQKVLRQEYILAARAKGISAGSVLWRHALRNALLPVITLVSDFFPGLLAGTVVLEVIFSLPGMGRLLADSVLARDYNVIIGVVLFTGTLKILSHVLADIAYKAADPRIRL